MSDAPKPSIKLVELDATQLKMWSDTKSYIQWTQPAFTHLLYKMLNPDDSEGVLWWSRDFDTLATDGQRIIANPDFFFAQPLPVRAAAVCHEIGHAMFHHCQIGWRMQQGQQQVIVGGKSMDYDPTYANAAQDYVINAMLHESGVGKLGEGWLHDPNIATADDSWTDAYAKIYKKSKGNGGGGGGGGGSGKNPGQFDQHLAPGTSTGTDPSAQQNQANPQQWQAAIAGAMAVAQAAGRLPAGLAKKFGEFLEPKVSWTDHIAGIFARRVGGGAYDFRRPDRRMIVRDIVAPGRSGNGAGTVVIGADSSGSIYAAPKVLERFFAEIASLLEEVRPKRILIMWCDAKVHRVDDVEDAMDMQAVRHKGAAGGGGTSFVPVFEEIEKMGIEDQVDALLYLTDGYGDFPDKDPGKYPVIWGNISGDAVKYPFGDVVNIPADGTA